MKSEKNYPFTLFEKWKVKWFFLSLFSRSESEIEIPRDRDREVKFPNNSREFSRNETLAGYCRGDKVEDELVGGQLHWHWGANQREVLVCAGNLANTRSNNFWGLGEMVSSTILMLSEWGVPLLTGWLTGVGSRKVSKRHLSNLAVSEIQQLMFVC